MEFWEIDVYSERYGEKPLPPPLFTNTLSVIYNHKPSVKDLQYTRVTTIIVQATVCPGMGLGP